MNPIRILVTGSRDFTDHQQVAVALDAAAALAGVPLTGDIPVTLVHGAARGLDTLAGHYARHLGWQVQEHPADWDAFGKSAGHRRNAEMVAAGADLVIGFPLDRRGGGSSRGTWGCIETATSAGLPVVVNWKGRLFPSGDAAAQLIVRHVDPFDAALSTVGAHGSVALADIHPIPF